MKKIFILSVVSHTEYDNELYSDIKVFTDKEEATAAFNESCDNAYEECKWGSQLDEEDKDEDFMYDVQECRDELEYKVSSAAYEGYVVEVKVKEVEV